MNNQDFPKLVDKYLKGECLPDEELLVEKYFESFQTGTQEWVDSTFGSKQVIEDKIYSKIMNKINNKDNYATLRIVRSPYLVRIAASIIFLIMLAFGALYIGGVFDQKPITLALTQKTTVLGEKLVLTLSDGSKITLNAESKLKYPAHFDENQREVYLEGEAYFEVHHDQSKPFIVHTGNISTTVLGTKFNVNAFPNEKEISVSLVEGSVKVSKVDHGTVEGLVMLQPDQQLVFDKAEQISTVKQFDVQEAVGWKDNILKFDNQPLPKVFVQLERRFGIKFELVTESFNAKKITANFHDESIWTISEVIRKLTGLHYMTIREKNELKKIVFYKK
ncbi:MAG: FecR domain-containing protein [Bacteroidetes bacterium]|nr:FecR domain-containing protein [Bacteroidota bacterium]MCL6099173.1 FecR domain-containing protein [Bacteroidota bacterium]